jgi:hypothetical protein
MEVIGKSNSLAFTQTLYKIIYYFAIEFREGEFNFNFFAFLHGLYACTATWNNTQKQKLKNDDEM